MPLGLGVIGPLPPTIMSVKGPLAPTITSMKGPRQPTITSVTGPLSPTVTLSRGPVETKPNVYIPICKHIGPCSISIFISFRKPFIQSHNSCHVQHKYHIHLFSKTHSFNHTIHAMLNKSYSCKSIGLFMSPIISCNLFMANQAIRVVRTQHA